MKAARDTLRKLASHVGDAQTKSGGPEADAWRGTVARLINLVYLGFESGRHAVLRLVEFQPAKAERTMVILITELKCYSFLLDYYKDDELRSRRLRLRDDDYEEQISTLKKELRSRHGNDQHWRPAEETVSELDKRYAEVRDGMTRLKWQTGEARPAS
jgi:hypothetical protein